MNQEPASGTKFAESGRLILASGKFHICIRRQRTCCCCPHGFTSAEIRSTLRSGSAHKGRLVKCSCVNTCGLNSSGLNRNDTGGGFQRDVHTLRAEIQKYATVGGAFRTCRHGRSEHELPRYESWTRGLKGWCGCTQRDVRRLAGDR